MINSAVKLRRGIVVALDSFSLTSHVLRDGSELSLQQGLEIDPQKNSRVSVMISPTTIYPNHGISLAAGDQLLAFCVAAEFSFVLHSHTGFLCFGISSY